MTERGPAGLQLDSFAKIKSAAIVPLWPSLGLGVRFGKKVRLGNREGLGNSTHRGISTWNNLLDLSRILIRLVDLFAEVRKAFEPFSRSDLSSADEVSVYRSTKETTGKPFTACIVQFPSVNRSRDDSTVLFRVRSRKSACPRGSKQRSLAGNGDQAINYS